MKCTVLKNTRSTEKLPQSGHIRQCQLWFAEKRAISCWTFNANATKMHLTCNNFYWELAEPAVDTGVCVCRLHGPPPKYAGR